MELNIIKRSDWDKSGIKPNYKKDKPKRIVIHHSYLPTTGQYQGARTIRGILNYHVKTHGWADIGYHYLMSPDGSEIFIGRPDNVKGAHCGGYRSPDRVRNFGNTGSIGIMIVGDYDKEPTDRAMLESLMELIKMISEKHNISLTEVYGHCENLTRPVKTCPGKNLFIELFGKERWTKQGF